jgi:hypothetical protein
MVLFPVDIAAVVVTASPFVPATAVSAARKSSNSLLRANDRGVARCVP